MNLSKEPIAIEDHEEITSEVVAAVAATEEVVATEIAVEIEETITIGLTTNFHCMKGTVKWYNETKGFGFIQTEENNDVFLHRSEISGQNVNLQPGQLVEFEVEQKDKGPMAVKVKTITA